MKCLLELFIVNFIVIKYNKNILPAFANANISIVHNMWIVKVSSPVGLRFFVVMLLICKISRKNKLTLTFHSSIKTDDILMKILNMFVTDGLFT